MAGLAVVCCIAQTARADFRLLHAFTGTDGKYPQGSLTQVGSVLYGMTPLGADAWGNIFQINTDGSGFAALHNFNGTDGSMAYGSLTSLNGTLYGLTSRGGGAYGTGDLFQFQPATRSVSVLHFFGSPGDGTIPESSVLAVGTTLYGTTSEGGPTGSGTVFSIDASGTGYTTLHNFGADRTDGASPAGPLLNLNNTLYGITTGGGSNENAGTIFKMGLDGSNYGVLHVFAGGSFPGYPGSNGLIASGSTLYGMISGEYENQGAIFKMNSDGSDFTIIHQFTGSLTDGASPDGDLILYGSQLIGMTGGGGTQHDGTIFEMNTDGTGFNILHSFGNLPDGAGPFGSLILSGNTVYGMTQSGGSSYPYNGAIFALTVPEPGGALLLAVSGLLILSKGFRFHLHKK